ncbi:MAG TPA: hypothetical protein DCG53_14080 [Syntrophus sp. (in: bacteria)]|jgi:hypothetical protein|nr:hypothetical protein [Syntrophus sp. (in: bacteria)]
MTRSDVFIQILTEIAKEHKEEVKKLLETFESNVPNLNKFDKELTAEEAAQLLIDFRGDKDSIRVWLLQGRNHFVSRVKKAKGLK